MKFFGHLKTVFTHKYYVGKYCFKFKLFKQGIFHDMSKFSPVEFFESVKYYSGIRSPIDACKEKNGYSNAWFHHKGRNKHHFEYWCDDFEKGVIPKKAPFKYVIEMFCDWLGAGVAYSKGIKNFTVESEINWWKRKRQHALFNPNILCTLELMFKLFDVLDGNVDKMAKEYIEDIKNVYDGKTISFESSVLLCESFFERYQESLNLRSCKDYYHKWEHEKLTLIIDPCLSEQLEYLFFDMFETEKIPDFKSDDTVAKLKDIYNLYH